MGVCKGKIVVALGGNALQRKGTPPTAEAQLEVVRDTCRHLAQLSLGGYEIAVVHGNGPQVGRIQQAFETAAGDTPPMPFDVCDAMSQGYIGYHLQLGMKEALKQVGLGRIPVVSLVTQVLVDRDDPAFQYPSKPVGSFYNRQEAELLSVQRGYTMKEDAGRGWRRVVPSPLPREILEFETIKRLWDSTIVITCGGGGIPVVRGKEGLLEGVAAVIDKDFAAELLAQQVEADVLMILTEVQQVAIHFGLPNQQNLDHLTTAQAKEYAAQGQFAAGSMLPKIQAAIRFVESAPGRKAIITSLDNALPAMEGRGGTVISNP